MDKKRVNEFGFGGEEQDQASAGTDVTAVREEEKKTNWLDIKVIWGNVSAENCSTTPS